MNAKILVAYASKNGATAEIAARIGRGLGAAGLEAEVRRAEEVKDLGPYTAVVLGSAVYMGQWRKEAAEFLKLQATELAGRPAWLFSSGPTGPGDPQALLSGWRFPEALQALAGQVKPVDIALFHGMLDLNKLSLVERLVVKAIKAPTGDFRDWAAIDAWTEGIAATLAAAQQAGKA